MHKTTLFGALIALLCCAALLPAQCLAPGTENFDGTTTGSATCNTTTNPGVLPAGWTVDATSTNAWRPWTGSTFSGNTGPSGDHTSGSGNYIYTETSGGCSGSVAILNAPPLDASTLTTPAVEFWNHMFGATQGTLSLEAWDATTASFVQVWTQSGNQGNQWNFVQVNMSAYVHAGTSCASEVLYRFVGTAGTSFTSDMALDDIHYGELSLPVWQTNSIEAATDVDGAQGNIFGPGTVAKSFLSCGPGATIGSMLNFSSANNPGGAFEVVISDAAAVPGNLGGVTLPSGAIVNLSLTSTLTFMNGGAALNLIPIPGVTFPGAQGGSFSVPFQSPPGVMSIQSVVVVPASAAGFNLSQASQLTVTALPPPASVPGPNGDEVSVAVDVVANCWTTTGVPFYGTSFTTIFVTSNGRVRFDSGTTDFTPTVPEALSNSFVGVWTDLNTSAGAGSTAVTNTAGIISADFTTVEYFGLAGSSSTFSMIFDTGSGDITLDMSGGINPNPQENIFMGLSGGTMVGATDGGANTFSLGSTFTPLTSTDMVYDFLDLLLMPGVPLPPSLDPAVNVSPVSGLIFTLNASGNYDATGI